MQRTLFTGIDSNFHSKLHSNEMLKMIVSYYVIYTNHPVGLGIKVTLCKISILSIVTGIYRKYYYKHLSCAKTSCGEI